MNEEFFNKFPNFEVENVLLRELKIEDAEDMLKYISDKQVARFLPENALINNIEDIKQLIKAMDKGFNNKNKVRWGITKKDNNKIIGDCGYYIIDSNNHIGKISYRLSKNFWGKGIMTKAIRRIVKCGFEEIGLNRIEASVIPSNSGSIKILEKIGFKKEGIHREELRKKDEFYDLVVYSILKKDEF